MEIRGQFLRWVFFVPIAVSAAGIQNDSAWGAEVSKSGSGSGIMQQIWPEGSFDQNSLTYSTTNPIRPSFASPREMPLTKDSFNLDFKTDREVDIKKFMPTDTQQQRFLYDNATPLYRTLPTKKSIPLLGLSVIRPLD